MKELQPFDAMYALPRFVRDLHLQPQIIAQPLEGVLIVPVFPPWLGFDVVPRNYEVTDLIESRQSTERENGARLFPASRCTGPTHMNATSGYDEPFRKCVRLPFVSRR